MKKLLKDKRGDTSNVVLLFVAVENLKKLLKDKRGDTSNVVQLFVACLLVAILLPIGIRMLWDVDTSGWPPMLVTIWQLLPLLSVVSVVIGAIYYVFRGQSFVKPLNTFLHDRRGEFKAGVIIGAVVFMLVFSILIPTAVKLLVEVNSTGLPSDTYGTYTHYDLIITLLQYVLPLIVIISLAIYFIRQMGE